MKNTQENALSIPVSLTLERAVEAYLRETLTDCFCRHPDRRRVERVVIRRPEETTAGLELWEKLGKLIAEKARSGTGLSPAHFDLEADGGIHKLKVRCQGMEIIFERRESSVLSADLPVVLFARRSE